MRGAYFLKSLISAEAGLASYYPRIRRVSTRDSRIVLIACMPKSGSTFLSTALAGAIGYRHSYLACAYRNVEQELFVPKILDTYGRGTVVQQHLRANVPNLEVIRRFRIRTTVLVRDIMDVLVSLRDHLSNERLDNIPSLYPPHAYREQPIEQQLDYVIDYFAPWLIQFYVSWARAQQESRTDLLFLDYGTCRADWTGALRRIADQHGLDVSAAELKQSVDRTTATNKTRMNKGVSGRGRDLLSADQVERVVRLTKVYPEVDFSPVLSTVSS